MAGSISIRASTNPTGGWVSTAARNWCAPLPMRCRPPRQIPRRTRPICTRPPTCHALPPCAWATEPTCGAPIAAQLVQMPTPPASVPEPLIAALYSYLLGEQLPGHGTNYLKQSLHFHALAAVDEPLSASVRITRLRADKALVNLDTHCHGADGRVVCSGQALVLFRC